jgi:hypothetical protein
MAKALAARFIPQNSVEVADVDANAVVYTYINGKGMPTAIGYYGKATKNSFHFNFRNEAARQRHIDEFFAEKKRIEGWKAQRKAERTAPHGLKVGDIVVQTTSYEMTSQTFYEVMEVSGKATVIVQMIDSEISTVSEHASSGKAMPKPGSYQGQPITCRANGVGVKIKSRKAERWDGKPMYVSFFD